MSENDNHQNHSLYFGQPEGNSFCDSLKRQESNFDVINSPNREIEKYIFEGYLWDYLGSRESKSFESEKDEQKSGTNASFSIISSDIESPEITETTFELDEIFSKTETKKRTSRTIYPKEQNKSKQKVFNLKNFLEYHNNWPNKVP